MIPIGSGRSARLAELRRHAPATLRNRDAIAAILDRELPRDGTVLEIASGSGEHAVFFAERFPNMVWQPSDPDAEALASIRAYRSDYIGDNLSDPVALDAACPDDWPIGSAQAIVCINMVHISPWEATEGLFAGAADRLDKGAALILYGPYFESDVDPAPSNLAFDESLRSRDASWGIRKVLQLDRLAAKCGLVRSARHEMPANNLTLVYRSLRKSAIS